MDVLITIIKIVIAFLTEVLEKLESSPHRPLQGLRIWVDEGHGGKYPGAVDDIDPNHNDHLYSKESDMNLDICNKLVEVLRNLGAEIFRTRTDDSAVELIDRTNRINAEHKASPIHLALSVHHNAHTDASVSGIETFYHANKTQDKVWADAIQTRLIAATGAISRGTKLGDYHMVREPLCPALLVELGFLTNVAEEAKLHKEEYKKLLIDAIVQGIQDVWTLSNKEVK